MISDADKLKISQQVAEVEAQTDAEIVVVVAAQSDNYNYVSTLWAALLAMLTPFIVRLMPWPFSFEQTALIQIAVVAIIALGFRYPPLLGKLIPRHIRLWRAANMARRQFLENNLHYTKQQTGVLIFVSLLEHYAEIIADRGIDKHVTHQQWQHIVDELIANIKQRQLVQGLETSVARCGEILIKHAPATSQKNELPDHVVVII